VRYSSFLTLATSLVMTATTISPSIAQPAMKASTFVMDAALSDMYEIQAGELAEASGQSSAVKSFGAKMVQAHTETSAKLKSTLSAGGVAVTPPAQLDQKHQAMLEKLKTAGAGFDREYISQQQTAHQEALALMQGYAASGDNPKLKTLAAQTVPVIQDHLTMIGQLK
jgi:putative membrane protein